MGTIKLWRGRVSDWRASGKTSADFSEGKEFSAGGLRHWAHKLQKRALAARGEPELRLGRVLRRPAPEPLEREVSTAASPAPEPLIVECGALRVAVRPGFDRQTLAAVLDLVAARGGAR